MEPDDATLIRSAHCIITDDYGRILLLHRAGDPGQWELPGGLVDEDEVPEQAVIRKINNELGIAVSVRRLLTKETIEEDTETYEYNWFEAKIVGGEPEVVEASVFDDLDYIEIEDLLSLALSANVENISNKIYAGEVALEQ